MQCTYVLIWGGDETFFKKNKLLCGGETVLQHLRRIVDRLTKNLFAFFFRFSNIFFFFKLVNYMKFSITIDGYILLQIIETLLQTFAIWKRPNDAWLPRWMAKPIFGTRKWRVWANRALGPCTHKLHIYSRYNNRWHSFCRRTIDN